MLAARALKEMQQNTSPTTAGPAMTASTAAMVPSVPPPRISLPQGTYNEMYGKTDAANQVSDAAAAGKQLYRSLKDPIFGSDAVTQSLEDSIFGGDKNDESDDGEDKKGKANEDKASDGSQYNPDEDKWVIEKDLKDDFQAY